ncbi:hypothetical protein HOU00_gp077 [Caulobacter phage CcrPW]|uniref:Uncharacterized protein n=1 Tax=Caulobacter phage CcrPW TaxID=2283271 RepID=A0A385EA57_9CAUD|nr:hypothetical protein HOU00_gp077 [Caulobacter phage CcrPW]AXQ68616.1 hypothetical protein CcrPW_gp077 [Caulobacter phage CcrPW]
MKIAYELRQQHDEMGNAAHLLSPGDAERINQGGYRRVAGGCTCDCGKLYYDHPPVLGALWLTRLCGGEIVKL